MKKLEFPGAMVIWVSAWLEFLYSMIEVLSIFIILVMGISYFGSFLLIKVASGQDAEVRMILFPSLCMLGISGIVRWLEHNEPICMLIIIPQVIILWRVWRWYSHEYDNPIEWSDT